MRNRSRYFTIRPVARATFVGSSTMSNSLRLSRSCRRRRWRISCRAWGRGRSQQFYASPRRSCFIYCAEIGRFLVERRAAQRLERRLRSGSIRGITLSRSGRLGLPLLRLLSALTIFFYPPLFYAIQAVAYAALGVSHAAAQGTESLVWRSAWGLCAGEEFLKPLALGAALALMGDVQSGFVGAPGDVGCAGFGAG